MKFVLFLLCNFTFAYLTQSKNLNDEKVGITNRKSEKLIEKAINALRDVILNGDKEFNIPASEPFDLKDNKWEFISDSDNFRLNMEHVKLSGLSEYETMHTTLNPKKLQLRSGVRFESLLIEGPYQLDGYLYKQWLPIFGEGQFTLTAEHVYLKVDIELYLKESLLNVEKVDVSLSLAGFPAYKVSTTGLMDLPSEFTDEEITEILNDTIDPYSTQVTEPLSNYALGVVKRYIEGKTLSEVIEFIDYFAKKT